MSIVVKLLEGPSRLANDETLPFLVTVELLTAELVASTTDIVMNKGWKGFVEVEWALNL